ncbi:MAG: SprB repeat-containing protein, partial [Bacteroidota bacterium]
YNNANNGTFTICVRENIPAAPTNQDCPNAIPICSNTWTTQQSFSGTGNILNEITPAISCLGSGERNDVWFTFTVQQSGNLNFNITPNNMSDDYDWAVYNLTNASCANIATTPGLQVSCNYSATPGNTGPTGATNSNSQGAAGNPFNQVIPVTAGQTYVVNVSNFSATADGFLIDFGASSAVIFDNIPPQLTSLASATVCGTSQLSFTFSENILCSTIQAGDFAITGPGGPYTVTGWSAAGCANGGTYTRNVTVTLSPPIRTPGTFQFYITNSSSSVTDLCQNVAPQDTLSFTINPITAVTSTVNATCNSANGAASVNPTSGTNPYSYSWSPTGGNGALASNLSPGNYTVTVTDADGCTTTQTAIVGNSNNGINATAVVTSVSCVGQNNGSISVTAIGAGPFNYIWNPNVGTGPTVSNLSPGSYSVVIADINGCSTTASYTVNPATPLTSAATTTNVRCYNGTTGSATVTPSGGTGPYTYSWSPSGGNG